MNKKLFLLFVVTLVFVFAPSVYAAELECIVKNSAMGTCTATYDETTTKTTVVITKADSADVLFGTPAVINNNQEGQATFDGNVVTEGNKKTYVITNALPTSKINSDLHYRKFLYGAPECETGGGEADVTPPSPVEYEETVTIKVRPESCYELESLKVVGVNSSREYVTTKVDDETYTFTMPAEDIKIVVRFKKKANCTDPTPNTTPTATPTVTPTPTPKAEGDVKVPDTDTYSYLTTFITLLVISSVGIVLYKKVS